MQCGQVVTVDTLLQSRSDTKINNREAEALIELLQQALAYGGVRETHEHEGIPSGQGKPSAPVQYELTQEEIDSIPF